MIPHLSSLFQTQFQMQQQFELKIVKSTQFTNDNRQQRQQKERERQNR